jgi:hypothetical protein
MNFIEVIFWLSPDSNTGSTESAIFLVLFVGLGLLCFWFLFERARGEALRSRFRGPGLPSAFETKKSNETKKDSLACSRQRIV